MSIITIIAKVEVYAEKRDLVMRELDKLVELTRKEEGCLQYDLHQDLEDANTFWFYERWSSKPTWQAHMESPNLKAYLEATEGAVANLTLNQMELRQ